MTRQIFLALKNERKMNEKGENFASEVTFIIFHFLLVNKFKFEDYCYAESPT